jgi:hypothetical protein
LFEQVARLAQETAQAFARTVPDEIARVPVARLEAAAWNLAHGAGAENGR